MGGRHITLCEFTEFDLNDLKTGALTALWLAQNVPVLPFGNGQLIVRLRTVNIASGGLHFRLVTVAPTAEDPTAFYRDYDHVYPSAGLEVPGPVTGTNLLYTAELTDDNWITLPSLLSLQLIVWQITADDALAFTVNVELHLNE